MVFIINACDIKAGGGIQVTDSICCSLDKYPQHTFVVVLSSYLQKTAERISDYGNVELIRYDYPKYNPWLLLTGNDSFMDSLVDEKKVDGVLSIFGPNLWVPKCPHISGFARPHLIFTESPYFTRMKGMTLWKEKVQNAVLKFFFKRSSDYFYTENPLVSKRLEELIPGAEVFTVTNYYNQIFDQPEKWVERKLPEFDGCTILCISAPYPHKNLEIAIDIAKYWRRNNPQFSFRFVYTVNEADFPILEEDLKLHFLLIGKCDITECPSLYQQSDICFLPSLLECFSATYPEAMVMCVPLVTTELDFSTELCGNAACYYNPVDVEDAANALYRVATDKRYREELVNKGKEQIKKFDTYNQRSEKLINILEQLSRKNGIINMHGGG